MKYITLILICFTVFACSKSEDSDSPKFTEQEAFNAILGKWKLSKHGGDSNFVKYVQIWDTAKATGYLNFLPNNTLIAYNIQYPSEKQSHSFSGGVYKQTTHVHSFKLYANEDGNINLHIWDENFSYLNFIHYDYTDQFGVALAQLPDADGADCLIYSYTTDTMVFKLPGTGTHYFMECVRVK